MIVNGGPSRLSSIAAEFVPLFGSALSCFRQHYNRESTFYKDGHSFRASRRPVCHGQEASVVSTDRTLGNSKFRVSAGLHTGRLSRFDPSQDVCMSVGRLVGRGMLVKLNTFLSTPQVAAQRLAGCRTAGL